MVAGNLSIAAAAHACTQVVLSTFFDSIEYSISECDPNLWHHHHLHTNHSHCVRVTTGDGDRAKCARNFQVHDKTKLHWLCSFMIRVETIATSLPFMRHIIS